MAVEQLFISRLHSHHSLARWSEYARTTEDLCSLGDLLVVAFFVVDLEFFFFSFSFFLKVGSLSRMMVVSSLLSLSSSLSSSLSLSLLRGIREGRSSWKSTSFWGYFFCSQFFNETNVIGRYREGCELSKREFMTCCKVEELVAALYVAERTETDITSGSRYHGVDGYIFFMNLCICFK